MGEKKKRTPKTPFCTNSEVGATGVFGVLFLGCGSPHFCPMHIIQAYKAYFRTTFLAHDALQPTDSDREGSVSFGIENLSDVLEGTIRTRLSDAGYLVLLLNPLVRPQSVNNAFDGHLQGGFLVMRRVSLRDSTEADVIVAQDEAAEIVLDMLVKMVDDSRRGHPTWQHGFDTIEQGNVDIEEMAFASKQDGSFVGYKVIFSAIMPLIDCDNASARLLKFKN